MNPSLREIAEEYAAQGLSTVCAFPESKKPAVSWRRFGYEAPTEYERDAMFSFNGNMNIGFVCGVASQNVALIDAESPEVFIQQVQNFDRVGKGDTWIAESFRGGHIYVRLPHPVAGYKADGFEVRGQGQFCLQPPSWHPEGKQYKYLHHPATIINATPDDLPWLNLQPARAIRPIPRKAQRLLNGGPYPSKWTRSEAEQSIIVILYNAGFSFEEVLALFYSHPAAGKFSSLHMESATRAVDYLQLSYGFARTFCVSDSPARKAARAAIDQAQSTPWPGRHGSTDRAVYLAHLTLAHQAGQQTYHASSRDLAEHASCTRATASRANKRLQNAGFMKLVEPAAYTYANCYQLLRQGEDCTTPTHKFLRSGSNFPFSTSDCFRRTGLGRPAMEVLGAIQEEALTALEVIAKTGRSAKTVRKALHRMKEFGFVFIQSHTRSKKWRGRQVSEIELELAARRLGTHGENARLKQKHAGERLRHQLQQRLRGIER